MCPIGDFGTVAMANVVPRFTVDPARSRTSAGGLGQDNREVYRDWLGLSEQQTEQLASKNII